MIGPPGCGKTTYVARQATLAVDKYGRDKVVICSLTGAAAKEAAGRKTDVAPENIGTLHAHCFRLLGRPKLATSKDIDAFNAEHPWSKISRASVARMEGDDPGEPGGEDLQDSGGELYSEYDLLRSRLIDRAVWPQRCRVLDTAWTEFKREREVVDFTDLIELGVSELPYAPGNPDVLFADEVQDFSRLELQLVRSWARHCESSVLVGDPLQSIYGWRGADPEILAGARAASSIVLSQSYRVSKAVHAFARRISRGLPGGDVRYLPTEAAGSVRNCPSHSYPHPESVVGEIERAAADNKRLMILATCSYMLRPLVEVLKARGVPFHNPFCPARWNPLTPAENVSTLWRLLAFLRPFGAGRNMFVPEWTAEEVRLWVPMLRASTMAHGAKKRLAELDDRANVEAAILEAFEGKPLDAIFRGDVEALGWLRSHFVGRYQKSTVYPLRVIARVGAERIAEEVRQTPRDRRWPILGTIHSVKGGEADTVLLFPDLSSKGFQQSRRAGWHGIQAIRRAFYVGCTRARETLVVGSPFSSRAVSL